MSADLGPARLASADEVGRVAELLDAFNREFDTPTPGPVKLADRLVDLLADERTWVVVVGRPAVAVGLVTLRTNVWFDGAVGMLDELYVVPELRNRGIGSAVLGRIAELAGERSVDAIEINVDEGDVDAQRFYERHGYSAIDADSGERAFYYQQLMG